ncbi:MAG: glucokinase [Alphaproteobacteria bacterium]|nr:glucokinase [Alphaproteobacteria bacterium]
MTERSSSQLRLVSDIGGTNVRLAVADLSNKAPRLDLCRHFLRADFARFEDVVELYLREEKVAGNIGSAVVAVAGPVENGEVRLTNGQWHISEGALKHFGFTRVRLVNDYVALALSAVHLGADELGAIGSASNGGSDGTIAIVGAGTGLGVSALVRGAEGVCVTATEGGHIGLAPEDDVEIEILRLLTQRFGRVSAERVLSGPGLTNLHWALGNLQGEIPESLPPDEIARRATSRTDALCVAALDRFCGFYGSFAGDIALAYGARGGVYLGGGIAPRYLDWLRASSFRHRFENKGRLHGYVATIETKVIISPYATLLGAACSSLDGSR